VDNQIELSQKKDIVNKGKKVFVPVRRYNKDSNEMLTKKTT
jgi:hypothetical protein